MNQNLIEKLIINEGCLGKKENIKLYKKLFENQPKYLDYNLKKYNLDNKKVLDIGCGYGNYLIHFGINSKGIDANQDCVKFAKSINLEIIKGNIEEKFNFTSEFDAIWASNILEHVIAPHLLLTRLKNHLTKDGLLFIYCPVYIGIPYLSKIKHFRDYLASEHINFFTKQTLIETIRSAGYRIIETNCAFTYNKNINSILSKIFTSVSPGITIVAKLNNKFKYSDKRIRDFTPKWMKNYE